MIDKNEARVRSLFSQRYALELRKIPESSAPTPDYNVYRECDHVAVLEVKGLEATTPVVTTDELAKGDVFEGAIALDNCAARVATKIHQAVRQLKSSPLPKILVLLNDDCVIDRLDLQEALIGYLDYEGEQISTLPRAAERRLSADRGLIDLFVWVDPSSGDGRPHFVSATATGRSLRSRYFDGRPLERTA